MLFETKRGYHVICFDIERFKVSYFPVYRYFHVIYNVDFEYGHNWILRLGKKGKLPAPKFIACFVNDKAKNKNYSVTHLEYYVRFCGVPMFVYNMLEDYATPVRYDIKLCQYLSWNY